MLFSNGFQLLWIELDNVVLFLNFIILERWVCVYGFFDMKKSIGFLFGICFVFFVDMMLYNDLFFVIYLMLMVYVYFY